MSYCLNSTCKHPQNPEQANYCLSCGSKLLLQERYRTLKPIAQGGFGRTFLAVDKFHPFRQRCVIKQFLPYVQTLHQEQQAAELFRQEALRLEVLSEHPQIPKFLLYHEQDGQQYLVQEFIDGQNLAQELAEQGAFNEDKIQQLLQSLLPVLQFVHDHQVIHRDIKPANIIRRYSDGQLVLVDFGAAKYVTGKALALTGTVIGSAEYTAPEQIRGKAVFTSDLYSLGVTCIYLLTQVSPFQLYDNNEGIWVWRHFLSCSVSESLNNVLDKLLHNATNRRYQSARAVLNELNFKVQPVAIKSLSTHQAGNREEFGLKEPVKPICFSSTATPVLSATVFNPQTQSWCRIPNLAEPSQLVWSLITSIPSNNLEFQQKASIFSIVTISKKKKRKKTSWLWLGLGAAWCLFIAGLGWQLHLSSSKIESYSVRLKTQL